MLGGVDDAACDVGAVVGGALQIRQQVAPHEARLDAALPLPHPQDVPRPHLLLQCVNDLLQRLHLPGGGRVLLPEGSQRQLQDIPHRTGQHVQLALCRPAERQSLGPQLLR